MHFSEKWGNSKTAHRRVKLEFFWDPVDYVVCICLIFDLDYVKVILGSDSFRALFTIIICSTVHYVICVHLTSGMYENHSEFWYSKVRSTSEQVWGTFDLATFKVIWGSSGALRLSRNMSFKTPLRLHL